MDQALNNVLSQYAKEIRQAYDSLGIKGDERLKLELEVQRAFSRGVNGTFHRAAVQFLENRFPKQPVIATAMGWKERSVYAQFKRSGRIDGPTLTYMITKFSDFKLPSRRKAVVAGYATAVTEIGLYAKKKQGESTDPSLAPVQKRKAGRSPQQRDEFANRCFTPEQFECLLGLFSNSGWLEAAAREDAKFKAILESQILKDLQSTWVSPFPIDGIVGLMAIVEEWSVPFLLGVDMIPISGDAS